MLDLAITLIALGAIVVLTIRKARTMSASFDALSAAVSANTAATNAAVAALTAPKDDLSGVTAQIQANTATLAGATPAP